MSLIHGTVGTLLKCHVVMCCSDLDYTKFQPYKTDNMYYLNSSQFEKAGYVKPSINSYVNSSEFLSTPYR